GRPSRRMSWQSPVWNTILYHIGRDARHGGALMQNRTVLHVTLLAGLCALTLLPAAAFRGLTGMEFRTALFVREILNNGPSLVPRLDGAPYVDYPPLYFLAAALSSRLLGSITPLSLALPSVLAAVGAVILVYFMTERERPGSGLGAGVALALTPLLFSCASQGNVDAMLLFFTTLTLAGCRRHVLSGARGAFAAACIGLAGGALTKGPIGVAVPLFAASLWLLMQGRLRTLASLLLKLGLFLAAFAAICVSAILLVEGRVHLERLMGAQIFDRVADKANAPRIYYLWVFLGGFAPWSIFALGRLFRRGDRERREFDWFCASWLFSTFLLLSLASIKHSRYLLPAAPPVAILAAFFWQDLRTTGAPSWTPVVTTWIRRVCLTLLAAGVLVLAIAPVFLPVASPALSWCLPAACLLPLLIPALRGKSDGSGAFLLLAWTMAAGFLAFSQFDSPRMSAKEEARPFVHSVERAAGGNRIVFYGIGKDADGLKFLYWRTGTAPLSFIESLPALRGAVDGTQLAILVLPSRERGEVEKEFGPRLRFLFGGRLGKRRCTVFNLANGAQ
ncbi:MAG: glycosyltransferase family 39 protein, partial [Planctomycetota bacterium]